MKCAEFQEVAAAYALDALPEDERLACVHHLEHEGPHEGCEALVARYEHTVDALAALTPTRNPSRAIWGAIEARIASTPGHQWREPLAWAVAAIALISGLWLRSDSADRAQRERNAMEQALANTSERLASTEAARKDCKSVLSQLANHTSLGRDAVSLLEHPATKLTPMQPAGSQTYRATALYNPETKRALIVSGTVKPVAGKDYELWVIATGETVPRPAGFLRFDPSGVALGELDPELLRGSPAAFAVSLEPAGGRPTPTEVVLLGKLQG
jgi:anti-sigma-K factor RskA